MSQVPFSTSTWTSDVHSEIPPVLPGNGTSALLSLHRAIQSHFSGSVHSCSSLSVWLYTANFICETLLGLMIYPVFMHYFKIELFLLICFLFRGERNPKHNKITLFVFRECHEMTHFVHLLIAVIKYFRARNLIFSLKIRQNKKRGLRGGRREGKNVLWTNVGLSHKSGFPWPLLNGWARGPGR